MTGPGSHVVEGNAAATGKDSQGTEIPFAGELRDNQPGCVEDRKAGDGFLIGPAVLRMKT
ncbi:hypothetical protein GCM10009560_47700 [Nonomuraea longicatena]|uniref:Uncharacterized protein n=1 Tax=Nonomuraea longicatena TaxID=83682 RepID=A0ABN1Q5S9_9ACTN